MMWEDDILDEIRMAETEEELLLLLRECVRLEEAMAAQEPEEGYPDLVGALLQHARLITPGLLEAVHDSSELRKVFRNPHLPPALALSLYRTYLLQVQEGIATGFLKRETIADLGYALETGHIPGDSPEVQAHFTLVQQGLFRTGQDAQGTGGQPSPYLPLARALLRCPSLPEEMLRLLAQHNTRSQIGNWEDFITHPGASLALWRQVARESLGGGSFAIEGLVQIPAARQDPEIRARLKHHHQREPLAEICLNAGEETRELFQDATRRCPSWDMERILHHPDLEVERLRPEDLLPLLSASNSRLRLAAILVAARLEGRDSQAVEAQEERASRHARWREQYRSPDLPF